MCCQHHKISSASYLKKKPSKLASHYIFLTGGSIIVFANKHMTLNSIKSVSGPYDKMASSRPNGTGSLPMRENTLCGPSALEKESF